LIPSVPRILSCLLCVLSVSFASSQDDSFTDSYSVEIKKNAAIRSAKRYLESKFSNKEISQHFVADSTSSYIVCDDYKTYFSSTSAYCPPIGFEIAFNVALNGEGSSSMLQSHLFLPVDSSFTILADSLEDVWRHGFFEAWENVISNKYKVNYSDVLEFVREKNLHDYGINFSFEKKSKRNFKFYWFVTEGSVLYRINPQSGAVRVKKLRLLKVTEDVSYFSGAKCSTPVDHLMPIKSAPIVSGNLENKICYLVIKLTDGC